MTEPTLVRARVLARVLGVKLLTLEAQVVLEPAAAAPEPAALPPRRGPTGEPRPIGVGLAQATRAIDEGEASLAAARNGVSGA
ncbi:MAG TPA: hypothetical protein VFY44_12850 [Thermoleophilaceae bacterium]|nr:hypothetical protein [Thermoleophilaceae bacterium]